MTQTKTTMFTNEMSYNKDTVELWKIQTYRRKVIDDMSNNKDTVGILECTHMKNADHRASAEHQGHGIYLCKTLNRER